MEVKIALNKYTKKAHKRMLSVCWVQKEKKCEMTFVQKAYGELYFIIPFKFIIIKFICNKHFSHS